MLYGVCYQRIVQKLMDVMVLWYVSAFLELVAGIVEYIFTTKNKHYQLEYLIACLCFVRICK